MAEPATKPPHDDHDINADASRFHEPNRNETWEQEPKAQGLMGCEHTLRSARCEQRLHPPSVLAQANLALWDTIPRAQRRAESSWGRASPGGAVLRRGALHDAVVHGDKDPAALCGALATLPQWGVRARRPHEGRLVGSQDIAASSAGAALGGLRTPVQVPAAWQRPAGLSPTTGLRAWALAEGTERKSASGSSSVTSYPEAANPRCAIDRFAWCPVPAEIARGRNCLKFGCIRIWAKLGRRWAKGRVSRSEAGPSSACSAQRLRRPRSETHKLQGQCSPPDGRPLPPRCTAMRCTR